MVVSKQEKKKEFFVFVCVIVRPKRHAVFLLMSIVRRVNCLLINNLNIFGIYQSAMIRDIFFFRILTNLTNTNRSLDSHTQLYVHIIIQPNWNTYTSNFHLFLFLLFRFCYILSSLRFWVGLSLSFRENLWGSTRQPFVHQFSNSNFFFISSFKRPRARTLCSRSLVNIF